MTRANGPTVLLASEHLSAEASRALRESCAQLGVQTAPWCAEQNPSGPERHVVVAELPSGARVVPEDITSLLVATRKSSALLLCDEPLVRPTLTLHGGRIALISPPWSPAKLRARLRLLLTDPVPDDASRTSDENPLAGSSGTHTIRRAQYWAGALSKGTSNGPGLAFRDSGARGFTALLRLGTSAALSSVWKEVLRVLEQPESRALEPGLRACLREEFALCHLSRGAEEWLLYLPRGHAWLASPERLPHCSDIAGLAEPARPIFFKMRAAAGDVVAAFSAPLATRESRGFDEALSSGAPAVFELVSDALARAATVRGDYVMAEVL